MAEPTGPRRNVEFKARDPDPQRSLQLALAAGAQQAGVLEQTDTYFHAVRGRLKLREQTGSEGRRAWLIPYERADEASARQSSYRLVTLEHPEELREALASALGALVVVRKRRELLLWRGLRIHLDRVDGLGAFIEIEAVADESSNLAGEHRLVRDLTELLKIEPNQLVSFSYSDILLGRAAQTDMPMSHVQPSGSRRHDLANGEPKRASAPLVASRTTSDWSIRTACEQDVESILALWVAAGSPPSVTDTRQGLCPLLSTDREALLVAEADGETIGSLIAAWDGWRASFYRLAVHPGWRRRGLATALVREGERRLQARGAVRLTAIVAHEDRMAMGFWEAAGYGRQPGQARLVRDGLPPDATDDLLPDAHPLAES